MQTNRPTISVIVPVYNAEKWLRRCIDSILAQTYTDFELLLIDDGSTDSSGAICDEYATKDSRVLSFHKPNGGVSSARNLGIDKAKGKWISFVDSDDYVFPQFLTGLCENDILDSSLVMGYATIWEEGTFRKEAYPSLIYSTGDLGLAFVKNNLERRTTVWGKLFNKNVIETNKLRFDNRFSLGEDTHFVFSYLRYVDELIIVNKADYIYNVDRKFSLSKKINCYDSERIALTCISDDVNWLMSRIGNNEIAKRKLNIVVGEFQRRILNSLYSGCCDRQFRLGVLKSRSWNQYLVVIKENSLQGRIYQYALKHNAYSLYDIIRKILKSLKLFKLN